MKMRLSILVLFGFLALIVVVPLAESTSATIAAPTAFLTGTFCPDNDPAAMFIAPGIEETAAILEAHGVAGGVDAFWIDLSLFDNAFAPGTFLSVGPFAPNRYGATYHEWRGLESVRHNLRALA